MIAAGADPMALGRGIHKAVDAVIEAIDKQAESIDVKRQETTAASRDHRRQQRSRRSAECWPMLS